jgi:prephenate dehydratase
MITDTLKIAFQGSPGAFSQLAAREYAETHKEPGTSFAFQDAQFIACTAFTDVFDEVMSGRSQFGVLPLENSSIGSISINYDLMWIDPVAIVAEIITPIRHHLIGLAGSPIEEIREVYSHPAALDQCRKFFADRPDIRPVAHFDTGGAVKFVAENGDPTKAAIASETAAQEYGLQILRSEVEDYPGNSTRFVVVSKHDAHQPLDREYKLSCGFELTNEPGSLAKVLSEVAKAGVNMTKLESRPIPETSWHYRFFLDLQVSGKEQDAKIVSALNDFTDVYKIFGRY